MYTDLGAWTSLANEAMRLVRRVHPQFVNSMNKAVSLIFGHIIRPLND